MRLDLVFVILFVLTIVFMLREMCIKTKFKDSDYSEGYRQAIDDVVEQWDEGIEKHIADYEMCIKMHKYLKRKLSGGG